MKIGIFGDSYGDDYNLWPYPYSGVGPSWVDYLRNQNIEIENFSKGGTPLFYSYQRFISTYQEYDKVIFLVTAPGRIATPSDITRPEEYFSAISVEEFLKSCTDPATKIKLNAILDYFKYVKNDEFDEVIHRLLIKDISNKHNDMLMIPCFVHSGIGNQLPLIAITRFEADFWNLKESTPCSDTEYDARKAHMCEENNLMLGQEMYNWVKTGNYNLSRKNFKTPTKEFSHYFRTDFKILRRNQQ
jgi:hypothetical protein